MSTDEDRSGGVSGRALQRAPGLWRTDLQQHDLAGDALTVAAGVVHAVRNVGGGNAAELATYVVEKGKPLLTLAE